MGFFYFAVTVRSACTIGDGVDSRRCRKPAASAACVREDVHPQPGSEKLSAQARCHACIDGKTQLGFHGHGFAQDADSKVACETYRSIGFVSDDVGLDADNCKVLVNIEQQSPDIAQGVHGHPAMRPEEIGAGDQGHMFDYGIDETPELIPPSHMLAIKLGARLTEVRKNGTYSWLRPDGKTQITVEYQNDHGAMIPIRVHTVLIYTQHDEPVTNDEIAADLKEHLIKPVVPEKYLYEKTIFHLNPSGRFVIGGPHGDAGLTGRKIIIDTYGWRG